MRLILTRPHARDRYLAEITVHTANNRRQELLETAREYLSADNFNTVLVKQDTERGGLFKEYDDVDGTAADKTSAACGGVTSAASLTESLYRLPQCHVSVSTKSLLDLAYDSLADMSGMEPEEATMVFYGVRDMFDLFRAVVPIKNREMLLQVRSRKLGGCSVHSGFCQMRARV
jgi:centromere/kinetochore protein ZW10